MNSYCQTSNYPLASVIIPAYNAEAFIDGVRWAILGGETKLYWPEFLISVVLVVLVLTSGIWYFRKTERTFADVI